MNLKINPYFTNHYHNYNNATLKKMLRNTGYALMATSLLSLTACSANKNKNNADTIEITTNNNDNLKNNNNKVKTYHHFFPKDDNIVTNEPDWSEKIYPDGSREIDSLGYKISITRDGKRTTVKTEKDAMGNFITTTEFSDGSKIIKTDYNTPNPDEKLIVKKTYWSDGKLKENEYYNEYHSDSTNINSKKIIEQSYKQYNENGVLLIWESSQIDPERNDSNNIYDRKGRLIYDDVKNEKYSYKGIDTIPYKSVSEYDDCKRITLYTDNGTVEKIYFKASDGTITEK